MLQLHAKTSHRVSIFGQVFRNTPLPLVVFEQEPDILPAKDAFDGPSRESSVKSFKRSVGVRIFCEKYLTVLASNKFLRSLNLTVLFISYFKLTRIYIYIFFEFIYLFEIEILFVHNILWFGIM